MTKSPARRRRHEKRLALLRMWVAFYLSGL
jgi:hypothetical protein